MTSGLVLICGNLTWFTVQLGTAPLEVTGQSAAPALSGLALAGLALAGALSIAPLILRYILGALQTLLALVSASAVLPVLSDPIAGVAAAVTDATGIQGDESVRGIVVSLESSPWPVVSLAAAIAGALVGLLVIVTARRWPTPGRKYDAPVESRTAEPAARGREDDWDALTRGEDPT
ncbi:Trp biosynthesis-associated membrane protein [Amnibacterium flavum]|uniref:Trp biosynthesis-associated membrane protein n=1 Tax=Amnibacterium flavum TaxID=2173173 RepID=UPI001401D417|nr:Trp biosynthesis-associated membrane protein [Amnibacterium flavum]